MIMIVCMYTIYTRVTNNIVLHPKAKTVGDWPPGAFGEAIFSGDGAKVAFSGERSILH